MLWMLYMVGVILNWAEKVVNNPVPLTLNWAEKVVNNPVPLTLWQHKMDSGDNF